MPTMNFAAASGEWNTAANWNLVGEETTHRVPLLTDDTTFTGLDGSGALTITTTAAVAKSIDFSTAGNAFTLSGSPNITISRSLTCKTGMTWSHSGILAVGYYDSGTLTTNDVSLLSLAEVRLGVNTGSAGNLVGTLTCKALYTWGGTLTTNNNTITCTGFGDRTVSGATTLSLGSSTINCTNVFFAAATLTVSDNTATINVTSTIDITSHLGGVAWGTGGNTSFVYVMTGGKALTLSGANTVGNLNVSWTSNNFISVLKLGADQVISGTLTITGSSTIIRPLITSSSSATRRTLTAGTVSITGAMDFRSITGAGAGSWDLSGIASGNIGYNTGITFRTPTNYYLVGMTSIKDYAGNVYSVADDGTADGTNVFPLPQDMLIINNNSGDNTGKVFTIVGSSSQSICGVDASALTESLGLAFGGNGGVFGDLILTGSGLTLTINSEMPLIPTIKDEAADTLDVNCPLSFGLQQIYVNATSSIGTVKLLSNILCAGIFLLSRGTLDINGKTLTCDTFSSSNTNTRTLQSSAAGGKIIVTGATGTTFNMATDTNLTIKKTGD